MSSLDNMEIELYKMETVATLSGRCPAMKVNVLSI